MKNKLPALILCIMIPLLVGGISGYLTAESIPTWYVTLQKPWFNPPNWIFGPVWTILYIMMGIASYIIVKEETRIGKKSALVTYSIQLILNFFWSILFFTIQNPTLSFVEIILLWLFIVLTILRFYKLNKTATYLLVPYLIWVSFASVLNGSIMILN